MFHTPKFFNHLNRPSISKVVLPKEYAPIKEYSFKVRRSLYGLFAGGHASGVALVIGAAEAMPDVTVGGLVIYGVTATIYGTINVFRKHSLFSESMSYKELAVKKSKQDSIITPWSEWDATVDQYNPNYKTRNSLGHL